MLPPDDLDRPDRSRFAVSRAVAFQALLLFGGVLAFAFLAWKLEAVGFLTPLLMAAAGAILVWPLREHRSARAVLLAGGFLIAVYLLSFLGGVLAPFIGVYLLAYLLDPLVQWADRRGWPRWASSLLVTLLALGALTLVVLVLIPNVIAQVELLAAGLLANLGGVQSWLLDNRVVDYLDQNGLLVRADLEARLETLLADQLADVLQVLPVTVRALFRSIGSILAVVTTISLLPVLLFYTLRDYPGITRAIVGLFPTLHGRREYLTRATSIVGSYLRGQLLVSLISATLVAGGLALFGIPLSLLIGLLTGVLNLIPNVGIVITNVLAVLIVAAFGDGWPDVAITLGVIFAVQIIEGTVTVPNIMSQQVGLHPVLVILSLFVFGAAFGIIGLLVAVPVTALLVTLYAQNREAMTLELRPTHGEDDVIRSGVPRVSPGVDDPAADDAAAAEAARRGLP